VKRALRLSSETLSVLSTGELADVVGADAPPSLQPGVCPTIPVLSCYVQTVRGC
jgi:hypothetical protein